MYEVGQSVYVDTRNMKTNRPMKKGDDKRNKEIQMSLHPRSVYKRVPGFLGLQGLQEMRTRTRGQVTRNRHAYGQTGRGDDDGIRYVRMRLVQRVHCVCCVRAFRTHRHARLVLVVAMRLRAHVREWMRVGRRSGRGVRT